LPVLILRFGPHSSVHRASLICTSGLTHLHIGPHSSVHRASLICTPGLTHLYTGPHSSVHRASLICTSGLTQLYVIVENGTHDVTAPVAAPADLLLDEFSLYGPSSSVQSQVAHALKYLGHIVQIVTHFLHVAQIRPITGRNWVGMVHTRAKKRIAIWTKSINFSRQCDALIALVWVIPIQFCLTKGRISATCRKCFTIWAT
jgi:hypothetical protein